MRWGYPHGLTPYDPIWTPLDPLARSPHGVRGAVPYYIWVYTPYGYRGLYGYICMYMYIHVYTYMYIYMYMYTYMLWSKDLVIRL